VRVRRQRSEYGSHCDDIDRSAHDGVCNKDYININKKEEEESASVVMLSRSRQASSNRSHRRNNNSSSNRSVNCLAVMVTEVVAKVLIVTGLSSIVGGRVVTVVVAAGIAIEVVTEEV